MAALYDGAFYTGLVGRVMNAGHRLLEKPFGPGEYFDRVIEVGAGTGAHVDFVRHGFGEYLVTDIDQAALDVARQRTNRQGVSFEVRDATSLGYPDDYFDRLVSVYNLEHLPSPEAVLREWARVVRPGGVLSIAVPTEGGMAWGLGRWMSTRRHFRRMGVDYDYVVAREHVNSCSRLVAFLRHYFPERDERWYPFRLSITHPNLILACTIHV